MLDRIAGIEKRFEEINELLLEVGDDYQRAAQLAKERAELDEIVSVAARYRQASQQMDEARALQDSEDKELQTLALDEVELLTAELESLELELKSMLLPKDPRDQRNVIMEIRAGTGGGEAALFAGDLFRMYSRYAERCRWNIDILSANETGIGGFKEVIFLIEGRGAFSRLKYESGVHRVQRIPITESQGRIHTSTATVAVLAEVDEVEIDIPENDLRIDVYKSAGAGGQNVQKNATAIRITHLPSGLVVQCQDERSQVQNRQRAMSILRARLYELEEEKRSAELSAERRSQVGMGERSEKIRTYNFPQSRITDHRINLSLYNLPTVLDGALDTLIDELATREEAERLAAEGLNV
jgi:peptide chain release factor 1